MTGGGGARYRKDQIDGEERSAAFHKLLDITASTAEYLRQMAAAPFLQATGLHEDYLS